MTCVKEYVVGLQLFRFAGLEIRLCWRQSCRVVVNGAFFVPRLDNVVNLNILDMNNFCCSSDVLLQAFNYYFFLFKISWEPPQCYSLSFFFFFYESPQCYSSPQLSIALKLFSEDLTSASWLTRSPGWDYKTGIKWDGGA